MTTSCSKANNDLKPSYELLQGPRRVNVDQLEEVLASIHATYAEMDNVFVQIKEPDNAIFYLSKEKTKKDGLELGQSIQEEIVNNANVQENGNKELVRKVVLPRRNSIKVESEQATETSVQSACALSISSKDDSNQPKNVSSVAKASNSRENKVSQLPKQKTSKRPNLSSTAANSGAKKMKIKEEEEEEGEKGEKGEKSKCDFCESELRFAQASRPTGNVDVYAKSELVQQYQMQCPKCPYTKIFYQLCGFKCTKCNELFRTRGGWRFHNKECPLQ